MKENLASLPTREIDALVDKNIFGREQQYHLMKRGLYYRPPANGYTGNVQEAARYSKEEAVRRRGGGNEVTMVPCEPNPSSTSITHAMDVLRKMKAEGWQVTINDDDDTWCVEFHVRDFQSGISVDAEHESLPTAICLAALECKGWV